MEKKRMRVFAGPNGSGKSTILKKILEEKRVRLGVYVNADDIESALRQTKAIKFSDYKLQVSETEMRDFFRRSNFAPVKRNDSHLWTKVFVDDNVFRCDVSVDSYLAADVAEFIRQRLLSIGASFTYETVMSHPGKVEFLNHAMQQGYRVYLYFGTLPGRIVDDSISFFNCVTGVFNGQKKSNSGLDSKCEYKN